MDTKMDVDRILSQFTQKAEKALAKRLVAVVLYGSAATGEFDEGRSDLNLLVLLDQLDVAALRACQPLFGWWLEQGFSWPLLLTPGEYQSAADAFPIELTEISAAHRVLAGQFELPPPNVQVSVHRAQLEHELRAKLLRLRQKAVPLLADRKGLLRLMENSLPTFLLLLRHTLLLSGFHPPFERREMIQLARQQMAMEFGAFLQVLDTRQGRLSPKSVDSVQLFESYLEQIQALVQKVDQLGRQPA